MACRRFCVLDVVVDDFELVRQFPSCSILMLRQSDGLAVPFTMEPVLASVLPRRLIDSCLDVLDIASLGGQPRYGLD